MSPWVKAAVQGAACGLALGLVLLIGVRVWRPSLAVAAGDSEPAPVVKARMFEVVHAAGNTRVPLEVDSILGPHPYLRHAAGDTRVALEALLNQIPMLYLSHAGARCGQP